MLRDKYGVKEGTHVLIEPRAEGILFRGRLNEILTALEHVSKLRRSGLKGPRLGDLKAIYLEMEFEENSTSPA